MYFTVATDQKRITLVSDGILCGKSCVAVEDEGVFDLKTGIGAAIMNLYLTLPEKLKIPLEGFPAYYLIYVDPAQLLEMTASGVKALTKYRQGQVAEAWGKRLPFDIIALAPNLGEIHNYREKLDDGSWYIDYDPKELN